jgi:hypothetical protein
MGELIDSYKILVTKLEGKRPLGRSRHRWDDDIGIDLNSLVSSTA